MDGFTANPETRRRIVDVDLRLEEMDASGTDFTLLSLNPPGVQFFRDGDRATALAGAMNDRLADIAKAHPTRFGALAAIAPQQPDQAAQELKRAMSQLGFGGVMINSHTLGHYLDEPQFEPILAAAEDADATIYLHPRVPSPQMLEPYSKYGMLAAIWGFQAEASVHAMRLIMSGVFDRHPKLRIVLGHLGEGLPFWLWRLDNIYTKTFGWAGEKLGMVKLARKPTDYLHDNFAVTTSGMDDPDVLAFVIKRLGADKIMFAIDFPYEDSATATTFLADAPLDDEQRALISHRNAERLFRIAPL